jgi:hypothetical protein
MNGTWFSTQEGGECQDGASTKSSLSLLFNANVAIVGVGRICSNPTRIFISKPGDMATSTAGRSSV